VKDLAKAGHWVGVDLGGTWVRVVLSDEKGNFLERIGEKVDKSSADAISRQIARITRFMCHKHDLRLEAVRGVGIAATGPLVQKEGVLIKPTNIPFDLVHLTKPVTEELGVPAQLINDCVGAALGESMFGAAKGLENFVFITIGTGIGCGAIVNGTLLLGKDGNGHEVGHFVIDSEGKLKCGCGKPGHWEGYCSGRNIPNFVRMRMKETPTEAIKETLLLKCIGGDLSKLAATDLFAAAKKHDSFSLKLVNELGILNAQGFANVISAYDPSLITVGGTVTLKNKRMILSPIRKHVAEYTVNRVPRIEITPLGDDVGLYGAVATAIKYLS
jgi:glucokinase